MATENTFQPRFAPSTIDPFMVPELAPPYILYSYAGDVWTNDPASGGVSMYVGGKRLKLLQGPRLVDRSFRKKA